MLIRVGIINVLPESTSQLLENLLLILTKLYSNILDKPLFLLFAVYCVFGKLTSFGTELPVLILQTANFALHKFHINASQAGRCSYKYNI